MGLFSGIGSAVSTTWETVTWPFRAAWNTAAGALGGATSGAATGGWWGGWLGAIGAAIYGGKKALDEPGAQVSDAVWAGLGTGLAGGAAGIAAGGLLGAGAGGLSGTLGGLFTTGIPGGVQVAEIGDGVTVPSTPSIPGESTEQTLA